MKIKTNSVLGWAIHIVFAGLMGWFIGYMLIPGISANVFTFILPELARIGFGAAIFAFYLYCYRTGFDTAFPFKNGGWLK